MRENIDILAARSKAFDAHPGPRVGDYIYIPSDDDRIPEYTRITHDWGDQVQTGGHSGSSYYLSEGGCLSYSGSLDPGIKTADLIPTDETRPGSVWFFDRDISGAGRGINASIPMRVFRVKDGADISRIYSRDCPYQVGVLTEEQHLKTCNYWFLVQRHGMAHKAFTTAAELMTWIAANRLGLTQELAPAGTYQWQKLNYVKEASNG